MEHKKDKVKHVLVNGSVARQVADILTGQIVNGEFVVGDFMPTEEEMCGEFNVGRSSIREAIKTLESRGLVRKLQGKGIVVIDESIDATSRMLRIALEYHKTSMRDLMDFRVALEMKIVELAAIHATEEDLATMKDSIDHMKEDQCSGETFATYDFLFHEAIAKASGNSVALIIIKTLRPLLYNQIVYTLNPDFNSEAAMHYHEHIYDAVKARHPKLAVKTMWEHLVETQRIINELDE